MDIIRKLTEELGVQRWQVEAAVKLIDEGNTIPFISRYRKEATGSLNDEVLRNLHERLTYLRGLEDKKNQVLGSIEEQGKLTEELKAQILAAETLVAVDDLYRPYRLNGVPGRPLRRKKVWTVWRMCSSAVDEKATGERGGGISFRGKGRADDSRRHRRSRRYPGRGHF